MGNLSPILDILPGVNLLEDSRLAAERDLRNVENKAAVDQINRQEAQGKKRRNQKLRQALAASRARLGGRGVGSSRGSGAAILDGLTAQTDELDREAAASSRDQINTISLRNRRNLLEEAGRTSRNRLSALQRFPTFFS